MSRFNHAYDIAFEVVSDKPDGKDVTPDMLKVALLKRIEHLDNSTTDKSEWLDACSRFDTHKEEL